MLGSALGSFSLVLAWRMHDKKDWVKGRSECDNCHQQLTPTDLIPILSWLIQSGKCRYCHKKLPTQLIFAEVGMGLSLALSYLYWPYELASFNSYGLFTIWIVLLILMSALFWYDLRWFILPNKIVYPLIYGSMAFATLRFTTNNLSAYDGLLMPLLSGVLLSGFFWALYAVSKGRWIGFGDVRLGFGLGLILGSPLFSWLILFFASLLGILVALPGILSGSKSLKSKLPFGPLLIVATIFVLLTGQSVIDLYLRILGL